MEFLILKLNWRLEPEENNFSSKSRVLLNSACEGEKK